MKAASDVDAMFLMGDSYEAGTERETRRGIIAADAAKAAGVRHLIYSSVADADKRTGIPHFESKYLVEKNWSNSASPTRSARLSLSWRMPSRGGRSVDCARPGTSSRCLPNASSSL